MRLVILGLLVVVLAIGDASTASADAFRFIRIGDKDGFGFKDTKGLIRGNRFSGQEGAADANGNGKLDPGEYLPDINKDGAVAWMSSDEFDHRLPGEILDKAHFCRGCAEIAETTRGSIWTDLALSTAAEGHNRPDEDGPQRPNNATFTFDFTVADGDIAVGAPIFFNLVFGDYDIDPAIVHVSFAKADARQLEIENHGFERDGLIQARSAVLRFDEVFSRDGSGNWRGFVHVVFVAPFEPYTAFDFVELSLFQIARPATEGMGADVL